MDIEELNKTQIILLALLVSFITSIATGIVTVSLMNQAPKVVTDTIHKVVEKTVEKVVPGEQQATVIKNTKTVVVSDEDFIISAVEANSDAFVRFFTTVETIDEKEEATQTDEFVGLGVIVSEDGKILVNQELVSPEKDYFFFRDGEKIQLNYVKDFADTDISLMQATRAEEDSAGEMVFTSVELGDSSTLKLGQSVVSLGGKQSAVVLTGIISNLNIEKNPALLATTTDEAVTPAQTIISKIETNLNASLPMNLLINLDGELIGVRSRTDFYIPVNLFKQALKEIPPTSQEEKETPSAVN